MDSRSWNIQNGYSVYGSDDKKIGTIKHCTDQYCQIDTGFLGLGPDYFIPMDAIVDVRNESVMLNVPGDQVGQMGWDREPQTLEQGSPEFGGRTGYRDYADAETDESRFASDRGLDRTDVSREDYSERSMPLSEEQLRARKERTQAGEVEVGKRVVEQEQTMDVPVSHEEAVIHQRAVDEPSDRPIGEGETISVPLNEERVTPEKESHVYSEVDVEKRKVTENQRVSDTVRKEVPEVNKGGRTEEFVDDQTDEPEDIDPNRRRAA